MAIIEQLASTDVFNAAYEWLCRRRRNYSANSDVWGFRRCWPREKESIKRELHAGSFRFSLLTRTTLKDGEETDLWSARDALVLKALAIVLAKHLPVSPRCTHIKGHGGAKYAVRAVRDHLAVNRFVLRTDVKSYYASIDHLLLLDQLAVHIKDRRVLNLIGQYLRRTSERGGSFWDYEKGISLGCPLSPLIGGFFLNALDAAAAKLRLFYVRFMDDILILAPSRWQLRGALKVVNQMLGMLGLEKHPDKTFIGRIECGFDFLGYYFGRAGLKVAKKTTANFIGKASRLYEQVDGEPSFTRTRFNATPVFFQTSPMLAGIVVLVAGHNCTTPQEALRFLSWENADRVTKVEAKIAIIKGRIAAIEYCPTLRRIICEAPSNDREMSAVGKGESAKYIGEHPLSSHLDVMLRPISTSVNPIFRADDYKFHRESILALRARAQRRFGRRCARDVRQQIATVGEEGLV